MSLECIVIWFRITGKSRSMQDYAQGFNLSGPSSSLVSVCAYACTGECMCVTVCVGTIVCVHMWKPEENQGCQSLSTNH